jgi:hypothetical protein
MVGGKMLRELAANLWVTEQPFRYLGMEIGGRTTVIRLIDGALFVHSPSRLDSNLHADLEAKGPVRFVVAPNRFHHIFIADYQRAFPQAEFYCAPGLQTKRPDLKFTATLTEEAPPGWRGQLEQLVFTSFSPLNEVVFFHRASRTVIFTDLVFNITRADSRLTKIMLTLDGGFGGPAVPRSFRMLLKWRREETRALIDRILQRDFDRVVVTHGDVIETDGKGILREAWSFI